MPRWTRDPTAGSVPPIVWLHGVPTCADDWLPFLAAAGGYAPDLPGFGRSSKRGDGDFTSYNAPWVGVAALMVVAGALALAGVRLPRARAPVAVAVVVAVAWAYALAQRGTIVG